MPAGFWVVAQTKPQQERWAAENVARQDFEWYLPLTLSNAKLRRASQPVCLFPRYLFVLVKDRWHSLLGTYGVSNLVMSGEGPAILPESAVESLRAREGSDGLIRLPNALEPRFKAGDPIRVNSGHFSGITGLHSGLTAKDRSKVLLDVLGRSTSVMIDDEHLERA